MRIDAIDDAHAIGTTDHLLMCLWRTATTPEAVSELHRIAVRHSRASEPMAMLTVVEATSEMPDGDIRGQLASLFQELGDRVSCSALIFEGDGFRAAAVRGIVTGINLVAKQPFPHKVFAQVSEAATWIDRHDTNLSSRDVLQNMKELRGALDRRTGSGLPAHP